MHMRRKTVNDFIFVWPMHKTYLKTSLYGQLFLNWADLDYSFLAHNQECVSAPQIDVETRIYLSLK